MRQGRCLVGEGPGQRRDRVRQGRGYGPAMCAMNVLMCATDADMSATVAVMYAKDAIRCAKDAATCNKVAVTCAYVRNRRGFVRQKRDRFASALNSPRFPVAFLSLSHLSPDV